MPMQRRTGTMKNLLERSFRMKRTFACLFFCFQLTVAQILRIDKVQNCQEVTAMRSCLLRKGVMTIREKCYNSVSRVKWRWRMVEVMCWVNSGRFRILALLVRVAAGLELKGYPRWHCRWLIQFALIPAWHRKSTIAFACCVLCCSSVRPSQVQRLNFYVFLTSS